MRPAKWTTALHWVRPAAIRLAVDELRAVIDSDDRFLYVERRPNDQFEAFLVGSDMLRRPTTLDEANSMAVQLLFMIFMLLYLDIKRYPEREKDRYAKRIGLEGFNEQTFRAMGLGVKLADPIQFIITRDPDALSRD